MFVLRNANGDEKIVYYHDDLAGARWEVAKRAELDAAFWEVTDIGEDVGFNAMTDGDMNRLAPVPDTLDFEGVLRGNVGCEISYKRYGAFYAPDLVWMDSWTKAWVDLVGRECQQFHNWVESNIGGE